MQGGALAQLVEQWTENPCVPGSIPGGTTKRDKLIFFEICPFLFFGKSLSICKIYLKTSLILGVRHFFPSNCKDSGNIELIRMDLSSIRLSV